MRMRLAPSLLLAVTAVVLPLASSRAGEVITFDEFTPPPTNFVDIPDGYHGLNWDNFEAINTVGTFPSGYFNGVVSGQNVAFNDFGTQAITSSGSTFTLNSGYFTGAWNDGLIIDVTGYTAGVQTYFKEFTVDTSGPTLETFDFVGIDDVTFNSFGGVHHEGFPLYGTQFALDDLTINGAVVPEPASLVMSGMAGLAGLGAWRRRRKSARATA